MSKVYEIALTGLEAEQRKVLQGALREASRSDAGAVLITIAPGAAHSEPLPAGLTASQVQREFHSLILGLFDLDLPVVAHLDATVVGLGLGVALACDVRYATAEASLAAGEAGEALAAGLPWLLTQRLGGALAGHLVWTGAALSARQALQHGLVTGIGSAADARAEAERLTDLPGPVTSAVKRSVNGRLRNELGSQLDYDAWLAVVAAGAGR